MTERLFVRLDGDPLYAPETSVPAGTMREFDVAAPLREHLAHIAAYREVIPAGHEFVERVVPDGAAHLIFDFGDVPSARVAGPAAQPVVLRLRGRLQGVSVTLRPGAVAAVLGVPAGEIAGREVPLEALWCGGAGALLERMIEAQDDAARVALLQHALRRRLRGGDETVRRQAMYAARLIAESGGQRPLREVADAIGVGERRLQQLFNAHVGLPPKVWRRLARLHACLRALRRNRAPRWPELAIDAGFYDQSHLVNEFRSLCGLPPRLFLGRAASGSSKTAS
jgi:AraC-like DNA-binding protein